ncbi:MAG: hypothetical protein CFE37_07520 [Alphaproteobacteria bacterium PA4]|nr:MAG: hypothetical protein CFE37_07520 [Alphaproteobacteria bacterium PA4]
MPDVEDADFDMVRGDPGAYFRQPQAILADPTLDRQERLTLLEAWLEDVDARSAATDEGMVPDRTGITDKDVRTRAAIVAARDTLLAGPDAGGTGIAAVATRFWHRLTGAG